MLIKTHLKCYFSIVFLSNSLFITKKNFLYLSFFTFRVKAFREPWIRSQINPSDVTSPLLDKICDVICLICVTVWGIVGRRTVVVIVNRQLCAGKSLGDCKP